MEETTQKLDALSLAKEHFNIVFIGHVDAGKSTIGGHILYLTGMVDKRTLEKFEKESREMNRESWYLSWALDTSEEERAKGITVECGRAHFETDCRRFTVLDAPGHKNFVPSMIEGASQADVAVLVISARKGEFESGFEKGGQTREHASLVKSAGGIKKLIVVINKMDEPTVKWSKERYDEILGKLTPFLSKQCGYNIKTEVEFIPISGFSGANLKDRVGKDVCPWYDGPSLLEYLDTMPSLERNSKAPFLMPIMSKYKDMGTMVEGKIEAGTITKGQNVLVMPNRVLCEVVLIQNEDVEVNSASAGENIRLKLKGIEEEDVNKGFVVCDVEKPVKVATVFYAQIAVQDIKNIISSGYTAVMHIHSCVEEITITDFVDTYDKKTKKRMKKKPMFARKGDVVLAKIECQPTCMELFDDNKMLGRFNLRSEGVNVAQGKVLKVAK